MFSKQIQNTFLEKEENLLAHDDFYSDMTSTNAMVYLERKEKFVQSLYIDMLIRESALKEKKERLKRQIDDAIDRGDRELFYRLVKELKAVDEELNA